MRASKLLGILLFQRRRRRVTKLYLNYSRSRRLSSVNAKESVEAIAEPTFNILINIFNILMNILAFANIKQEKLILLFRL